MAATKTLGGRGVPGATTYQRMLVVGDASYPTGGYPLLPSDFGFSVLRSIEGVWHTTAASVNAYAFALVETFNADGKTLAQVNVVLCAAGAQVAAGTNVTGASLRVVGSGN